MVCSHARFTGIIAGPGSIASADSEDGAGGWAVRTVRCGTAARTIITITITWAMAGDGKRSQQSLTVPLSGTVNGFKKGGAFREMKLYIKV